MNIIQAIDDNNLLGPLFKNPATWQAWRVYLKSLFGLPIEDRAERRLFKQCTGLKRPRGGQAKESFVICGRRSGKSFISAVVAVYLACFRDWRPFLAKGEVGHVFIIATDRLQARIIKNYISGILASGPILKNMIKADYKESIELKNDITITIKTASFRGLRGYTLVAAILEELAFWRSEDSANPDKEILAAVRPGLATVEGSLLLGISTPYSRSGVLWEVFKKYYGQSGGPLIWKAPTTVMNPTIDKNKIREALRDDPEAARAEWEADWRSDITSFMPLEAIEACVIPGRRELPKIEGAYYSAFIDPSGGRQDSFTLGIAHTDENGKIILDVIRERVPPFRPEAVCEEFAAIIKSYQIFDAWSDKYAGEWVTDSFRKFGIGILPCEKSASELYLEFIPEIMQGNVELLDNKRLINQLSSLERRTRAAGKDLISHFPGGHDDLANAVAGACVKARQYCEPRITVIDVDVRRFF